MSRFKHLFTALPALAISAAVLTPAPAHAMDWNVLGAVVDAIATVFSPPPPPPPVYQPTNNNNYGYGYGAGSVGPTTYPIMATQGIYQYTGSDGKTYYVDNGFGTGLGNSRTVPDVMNTDIQGINSPGFRGDGTGNTPSEVGAGNYPWPTKNGPLSSTYGNRERVGRMCHKDDRGDGQVVEHCGVHMHNGLDIAVASGTPINSVASGKVVWVSPGCKGGPPGEAGCTVSIMKPDGEMSTYMHLSGVRDGLNVGDVVGQGEEFAYSGNSGSATTGAHLHFEMCQVPPERATGSVSPLKLCQMGQRINPLSKLSAADPRYNNACRATAKSPLNSNITGPCGYKGSGSSMFAGARAPDIASRSIDTRQSNIADGWYTGSFKN